MNYKMKKKSIKAADISGRKKRQQRITDFTVVRRKRFGDDFKPGIVSYPNI